MQNKRGSHVGMILSFVVFVTFVIFVYTILEPATRVEKDKQALLSYLKNEILKETSENLTSISVVLARGEKPNEVCLEFENFLTEAEIDTRIVVQNETDYVQGAYLNAENLKIIRTDTSDFFFKVYNSPEFEPLSGTEILCKSVIENKYDIGLVKITTYLFESKIISLINEYISDYEALRERINIPGGSEFDFSLVYSNKTIITSNGKDVSTNIYADELPIQYVDEDANIHAGYLNIRVW